MNSENLNVAELSAQEVQETEGGLVFLAAIPLAKAFAWGVGIGVATGLVVLDHILDEQ